MSKYEREDVFSHGIDSEDGMKLTPYDTIPRPPKCLLWECAVPDLTRSLGITSAQRDLFPYPLIVLTDLELL